MKVKIYDITGKIHYHGEDYLRKNIKWKILMTDGCNIPRRIINDEIMDGERKILLSN